MRERSKGAKGKPRADGDGIRARIAGSLRRTVPAALILATGLTWPEALDAQFHGVTIFKSCVTPKNSCAMDADCGAGACGAGQCATEEAPGSNVADCTITLSNHTTHADNVSVVEASDAVIGGTGSPSASSGLRVIGTTGTVSGPGCDAGSDLGGVETCLLAPGASIRFRANYYVIRPADPNPLPDQASIVVVDTCSGSVGGCSTTPNIVQFSAATDLVSGCSPAPTCTPTPTSTPTATHTPTPTRTPTPTPTPGPPGQGCGLLVIDEDSIDNGLPPNFFSDRDVNDHIAEIGLRSELPFFAANPGRVIDLWTGTVGDEGWFAVETIPASWATAGPTSSGLTNFLLAGPGLGSGTDREALLDKIPDVTPLRASGLRMLEGSCICAVVYDSDISINYDPLNGSLKGANLGIVAFDVLDVTQLTGQSSGSLPRVTIAIRDADTTCAAPLTLFDAPAPISSSIPYDVVP